MNHSRVPKPHQAVPADLAWIFRLPVPQEAEELLPIINASSYPPVVQAGLLLMLRGMTVRKAADLAGCKRSTLQDAAARTGVAAYRRGALATQERMIAGLANDEILRRLEEAPEKIPDNVLSVVKGVAVDKAAKLEGWGKEYAPPGSSLDELLERVRPKPGEEVTIKVKKVPPAINAQMVREK